MCVHPQCVYMCMYMYVIMCKCSCGGQKLTLWVFYFHYSPSESIFHLNSELTALLDWLDKEHWRPKFSMNTKHLLTMPKL